MTYIEPNLKVYSTLKELMESVDSNFFLAADISTNDLSKKQKIFLISEPGYGKTRLLKEHLLRSKNPGVFLDLKKIGIQDIAQYISTIELKNINNEKYDEDIHKAKCFRTKDFKFQENKPFIFCFDALDEVKTENFSEVVENIKKFIKKHNQSNILISCRKNYLRKWQHLLSEININYIEILQLNKLKIKEFLNSFNIDKDQIAALLEKLQFQNRSLIIQIPRYLEMIAELAKKEDLDIMKNISRSELFEMFIYQKLNVEAKKTNDKNNKEIIKRVLEKLALIMEIYQSNQITKDELMEFFDDTKSNLNISFLNQVSIDTFYDRSLLKNNIDTIEFENTEFQEYLAAKELLRLGRNEQVVFDLAVVPELEEINPSWINTLYFVVEQDISLLKKIFEYVFSNDNIVHIDEHIQLLTKNNIEKLNPEDRRDVFVMVYSFYQNIGHWVDYHIAEKLSFYYDNSLYEYIEKHFAKKEINGERKTVAKVNTITLIGFLLDRDVLTQYQKDLWKKRLNRFLNAKNQNAVVLRRTLLAIGRFKDLSLFATWKINKILNANKENTVITYLIYTLEDIDPNASTAFNFFLKGIKARNNSARRALSRVDKKEALKQVLGKFTKDEDLLQKFIEGESTYQDIDSDEFIKNIQKITDKAIIRMLNKIVIKAFSDAFLYKAENSNFIKKITLLIDKHSPNFIFKLIKNCNDNNTLFAFKNIFALLLKKRDIQKFIKSIKKSTNGQQRIALHVLQLIKFTDRIDSEEVYEHGRKYFHQEYKQSEIQNAQFEDEQKNKAAKTYEDFKSRLEPEKDKYNPSVFQFYVDNKSQLEVLITSKDKKRLEKLIKESIFEMFDPGEQMLAINSQGNGTETYTTHSWVQIFGDCILASKELGINVSKYHQKILNYIPFALNDICNAIFSLIPKPTNQELRNVLNIYKNRKDDLIIFRPSSTIHFCEKQKLTEGIHLLKTFVDSEEISLYERSSALKAISKVCEDGHEYYESIFNKYESKKSEDKELAYIANEILINKFEVVGAIEWRFKKIIERAFPFQRPEGPHYVGELEDELVHKKFAQPLVQQKKIKHKDKFLKLLNDSFEILKKGDDYSEYTTYIWSIVIEYFKNLKEIRSFEVLNDLDKFIRENNNKKGMNWFLYQYKQLKFEYIIYIGKPQNISNCIKKYNYFKERIYLSISTPRDLLELVKNIVENNLRNWIESEGAYKFIEKYKPDKTKKFEREDLIQKTIKTQLENGLLKAELRKEEIHIQRESQLLDDKRTDFLISYGFVGPILLEIKLTKNPEITNNKNRLNYKKKLIQYINATHSYYGIFIIFQTEHTNNTLEKYLPILNDLYKSEKNIEILGLNCMQ